MLVARFALHLPRLLLRILQLALPVAPFGPYPASLPPRDPPSGPNKHPSNRPRPARRRSALTPLPSPLYPSSPHPSLAAEPSSPGQSHDPARSSPHRPQSPSPSALTPSSLSPSSPTPTTDSPENPPKHAPSHLKSFLEKTLTAREAPRSTPRQHPQCPCPLRRAHAPCPGNPPPHPRRASGPTRPAPVPSLGAVGPGVRSSKFRSKKSAQTVSRQPAPSRGGLARDGSPLHPHASAARAHPAAPCTLLPRSTVTPESRS